MTTSLDLSGKTMLVTGASRGIGHALVDEALTRGAATIYAAARTPLEHPDQRVRPIRLDLTDLAALEAHLAAALSMTQSWRFLLAPDGVSVYAALPDPVSVSIAPGWDSGIVKTLERGNAAAVAAMGAS